MRVLTEIGEQGITVGDREVKFRPSFYAMTKLGDPERIVELFVDLHKQPVIIQHEDWDGPGIRAAGDQISVTQIRRHWRDMLFLSWEVLTACTDEDVSDVIGCPGARYGSYRIGKVDPEIMLAMARSLMHHGCVGQAHKNEKEGGGTSSGGSYVRAFEALQYVSLAVAHLGLTEDEAWNMTMSSFQGHWEAKHGKQKERRYVDEHVKTMEWLASINAIRDENPWQKHQ